MPSVYVFKITFWWHWKQKSSQLTNLCYECAVEHFRSITSKSSRRDIRKECITCKIWPSTDSGPDRRWRSFSRFHLGQGSWELQSVWLNLNYYTVSSASCLKTFTAQHLPSVHPIIFFFSYSFTGRTRNTSRFSATSDSSAGSTLRQDQASSWNVTPFFPRCPLGRFSEGAPSTPAGLASPFFPGAFWLHGQITATGFFVRRRRGSTLKVYECHSCALCREVSRQKLFAKIASLPFVLEIALFSFDHYQDSSS